MTQCCTTQNKPRTCRSYFSQVIRLCEDHADFPYRTIDYCLGNFETFTLNQYRPWDQNAQCASSAVMLWNTSGQRRQSIFNVSSKITAIICVPCHLLQEAYSFSIQELSALIHTFSKLSGYSWVINESVGMKIEVRYWLLNQVMAVISIALVLDVDIMRMCFVVNGSDQSPHDCCFLHSKSSTMWIRIFTRHKAAATLKVQHISACSKLWSMSEAITDPQGFHQIADTSSCSGFQGLCIASSALTPFTAELQSWSCWAYYANKKTNTFLIMLRLPELIIHQAIQHVHVHIFTYMW